MELAKQAAHQADNRENHRNLQNQREKIRHQCPPLEGAGAWRSARNATDAHAGQFATDSVPISDLDSGVPFTLARIDSWRPPQLASEGDPDCMSEARSVVPSRVPERVPLVSRGKLSTSLPPDGEIAIVLSLARILPQGRESSCAESTCRFQRASIDTGATNLRPLLRIPANPTRGRITRKA